MRLIEQFLLCTVTNNLLAAWVLLTQDFPIFFYLFWHCRKLETKCLGSQKIIVIIKKFTYAFFLPFWFCSSCGCACAHTQKYLYGINSSLESALRLLYFLYPIISILLTSNSISIFISVDSEMSFQSYSCPKPRQLKPQIKCTIMWFRKW